MSRRFISSIIAAILTAAGTFLLPLFVFAQSPELQTAVTAVDQSIDKLLGDNLPVPTDPEALAVSRTALNQVYDLTKEEISTLQEKLIALKNGPMESEMVVIREKYLTLLTEALKKVQTEQKQLNAEDIKLEAVQAMAQAFKQWREETWSPLTHSIFDLTFLFQGKGILKIADARFEKVATDINTLEKFYGNRVEVLKPYLNSAASHLKNARNLTAQAREVLLDTFVRQYPGILTQEVDSLVTEEGVANILDALSPDSVFATPGEASTTPSEPAPIASSSPSSTPETAPIIETPTVQSLMVEALKEVGTMYKDFLQMITVAKEQKLIK